MMIPIKAPRAISPIPTLPTNLHCRPLKISCARGNREVLSDEALAAELTREFRKLNSQTADREEALKKSRQILFAELCDFSGLRSEELRKRWRRMSEEERWSLAKGFVAEWSARWHPLSARSVKEMVDEHLGGSSRVSDAVVPGKIFSGLKKLLGGFWKY